MKKCFIDEETKAKHINVWPRISGGYIVRFMY